MEQLRHLLRESCEREEEGGRREERGGEEGAELRFHQSGRLGQGCPRRSRLLERAKTGQLTLLHLLPIAWTEINPKYF